MKQNLFKKTRIATSMSLLLGATMHSAIAQEATADADNDMVEVIEVSGIRGSVIRSMDVKRASQGIVDAISAEEMGKFPDTNLAESLQRITGVSIDRQNGEGSKVTVRGFGPDYNLVLLNGRHMPASSLEATSASTSRSFDFANIASEGIAGVELYKTGKAHVPTGGMGATINILTTKPLNAPGLKATFGVKGVVDESSDEGDSVTPELSGLYSNTFADDTFGVAISGSYQKRDSGYAQANTGGWRTFPGNINGFDWAGGNADWGGLIPDGDNAYENYPEPTDVYSVPQSVGYNFHEIERVRTNGQLTLQYRPVDNITTTLDYTYAKNELDDRYNDVSAWYNFGPSRAVFTDGPAVAPLVYTEAFGAPGDLAMGAGQFSTVNENKSIGFNVEWEVNSNLELVFDIHDSSAESLPNSPYGSNNVIGTATWVRSVTTTDFSADFPVLSITYPDGVSNIRPQDVRVTGSSFRNSQMRSDIQQAQISGSYAFDTGVLESVDFGYSTSELKNRSAFSNVQQDNWGGLGEAGDIDPSVFTRQDIASRFDNDTSSDPALQPEFFVWDFNTIRQIADQTYGALGAVGDCGTSFCASSDMTTDRRTQEDIDAVYLQANLSGDLGSMTWRMAVGARYEETDVTSSALVPTYTNIAWAGDNEFSLIPSGEQDFTTLEGSYENFLPSIDFNLDLTDELMLRASYGKTMSRPGYGFIQGGKTVDSLVRINGGTGSQGNPGLKPFESTNFDLALEWYYDEGSYASIGYFTKDGKNFAVTGQITETTFDLPHPAQGARYNEAVAALGSGATNTDIRNYIIENYPETVNADGFILGVPGEDPAAEFTISVPINGDEEKTDGWELAVQHLFGESGFGVIANATIVNSDFEYDVASLEPQSGLLGVSDSANFIGFYDKDGIQVRVAYNWRDKFLASDRNALGLLNPIFVEDYGQWDVNASYAFNENLTFFIEALNVTDEAVRSHERNSRQLVSYTETGPRYNIGARYTF